MDTLSQDIAAFQEEQARLETDHIGKWVVFCNSKLEGIYPDAESAAEDAVRKFGRGPYLIRQIGAPPLTLPASVMYHPLYANH